MSWRDWLPILFIALYLLVTIDWRRPRRDCARLVEDLPRVETEWQPETSVFDSPERFGYRIYTDRHDRIIEAAVCPPEPGAAKRRQLLDEIIESNAKVRDQLTVLVDERGIGNHLAAAVLIDHSGSMNRSAGAGPDQPSKRGSIVSADSGAVRAATSIAAALEHCGATVEILGFTTGEWQGGKSRKDWLAAGKPAYPGRLNDLLYIIYKRADETTSVDAWNLRLERLLDPSTLKENIDGEAIAWARKRLLAHPGSDHLLIFISDGASVDDSTLSENGPSYLERHLVHVVEDVDRRPEMRIVGMGIGYDLSHYIPSSLAIGGANPSF